MDPTSSIQSSGSPMSIDGRNYGQLVCAPGSTHVSYRPNSTLKEISLGVDDNLMSKMEQGKVPAADNGRTTSNLSSDDDDCIIIDYKEAIKKRKAKDSEITQSKLKRIRNSSESLSDDDDFVQSSKDYKAMEMAKQRNGNKSKMFGPNKTRAAAGSSTGLTPQMQNVLVKKPSIRKTMDSNKENVPVLSKRVSAKAQIPIPIKVLYPLSVEGKDLSIASSSAVGVFSKMKEGRIVLKGIQAPTNANPPLQGIPEKGGLNKIGSGKLRGKFSFEKMFVQLNSGMLNLVKFENIPRMIVKSLVILELEREREDIEGNLITDVALSVHSFDGDDFRIYEGKQRDLSKDLKSVINDEKNTACTLAYLFSKGWDVVHRYFTPICSYDGTTIRRLRNHLRTPDTAKSWVAHFVCSPFQKEINELIAKGQHSNLILQLISNPTTEFDPSARSIKKVNKEKKARSEVKFSKGRGSVHERMMIEACTFYKTMNAKNKYVNHEMAAKAFAKKHGHEYTNKLPTGEAIRQKLNRLRSEEQIKDVEDYERRYKIAVQMVKDGSPLSEVTRETDISRTTYRRIRIREQIPVGNGRRGNPKSKDLHFPKKLTKVVKKKENGSPSKN